LLIGRAILLERKPVWLVGHSHPPSSIENGSAAPRREESELLVHSRSEECITRLSGMETCSTGARIRHRVRLDVQGFSRRRIVSYNADGKQTIPILQHFSKCPFDHISLFIFRHHMRKMFRRRCRSFKSYCTDSSLQSHSTTYRSYFCAKRIADL